MSTGEHVGASVARMCVLHLFLMNFFFNQYMDYYSFLRNLDGLQDSCIPLLIHEGGRIRSPDA